MSIDQAIDAAFAPVAGAIESVVFYAVPLGQGAELKLILLWLVAAGVFFTAYLGFVNIRCFGHALGLLREGPGERREGQIGRLQALATSLSGTVGLGNIAGVAVAISAGGPGATLWMALAGLLGMSTKFAEVALGVRHRVHPDGAHVERISGGPMYYIRAGVPGRAGIALAGAFSVFCVLGTIGAGSLFQTKSAYDQLVIVTGGDASFFADKAWLFGLAMAGAVGTVIIGGIRSIAAVAGRVVPFMGLLYIAGGLAVIALNADALPGALQAIFAQAFTPAAGLGGVLGVALQGVQRAAFSNEAGIGSAAIAHAAARTDDPVSQGMVGMLGPFIDTVVICTITALVIVVSGVPLAGGGAVEGIALTSRAFASGAAWMPTLLFAVVLLFAYSTMIAWSYYGLKAFTYLAGTGPRREAAFKLAYCAFVVVGASASLGAVVRFTDAAIFAMAVPNIIGLYALAPALRRELRAYLGKISF